MPLLKHPRIAGMTIDVTESRVAEHLEQGWLLDEPEAEPDESVEDD